MGKKYIIEIKRLERLYKAFINAYGKPEITWLSPEVDLTPYTEPDLERVKKTAHDDGYSEGYQAGREDLNLVMSNVEQVRLEAEQLGMVLAWDAAKKVSHGALWDDYRTDTGKLSVYTGAVLDYYTAAEAIEKLKTYEQEQNEIQVGDEVAFHHDDGRPDTVVVVTYIGQDGFIDGMDGRGTQYAHKNPKKWTKTGKHFPEVAAVLEKMREDGNQNRIQETMSDDY